MHFVSRDRAAAAMRTSSTSSARTRQMTSIVTANMTITGYMLMLDMA